MIIMDKSPKKCSFGELPYGYVFELHGDYFIKVNAVEDYDCGVNLYTDDEVRLINTVEVRPYDNAVLNLLGVSL